MAKRSKDDKVRDIVNAYKEKKLSFKQSVAQLYDLGLADWEIALYLDNDQTGPE